MHMYKAQASPCDICSACGETLTHCWAPLLPGAEYSVLAAYCIQTEHCGNTALLWGAARCLSAALVRCRGSHEYGPEPEKKKISDHRWDTMGSSRCWRPSVDEKRTRTHLSPQLHAKAVILALAFRMLRVIVSEKDWIKQHGTIFNYLLFSIHSLMMFYTQSPLSKAASTSM